MAGPEGIEPSSADRQSAMFTFTPWPQTWQVTGVSIPAIRFWRPESRAAGRPLTRSNKKPSLVAERGFKRLCDNAGIRCPYPTPYRWGPGTPRASVRRQTSGVSRNEASGSILALGPDYPVPESIRRTLLEGSQDCQHFSPGFSSGSSPNISFIRSRRFASSCSMRSCEYARI